MENPQTCVVLLAIIIIFGSTVIAQNRSGEKVPAMPRLLSQRQQAEVREGVVEAAVRRDSAADDEETPGGYVDRR